MSIPIPRLRREETALFVVDVQQRLLPAMFEAERIVRGCSLLVRAARLFEMPVVVTEQSPEKLGATNESLAAVLGDYAPVSKTVFSACADQTLQQLRAGKR